MVIVSVLQMVIAAAIGSPNLAMFTTLTGSIGQSGPPLLPPSFYGFVTMHGAPFIAGAMVTTAVDGISVAETTTFTCKGRVYYRVNIPSDDPATTESEGGVPGDVIRFKIDNIPAIPSVLWIGGTNRRLDLAPTQRHHQQLDEADPLCTQRNRLHGPTKRGTDNGRGSRQAVEGIGTNVK